MHLGVVVCTAALNWFQCLPLGFVPVSCWRQNQHQTGYLDRCMVAAGVTDHGGVWSCVWSGPPASALRSDRGSPRVLTCMLINWRSCSVPVSRASDPCIGYLRRQWTRRRSQLVRVNHSRPPRAHTHTGPQWRFSVGPNAEFSSEVGALEYTSNKPQKTNTRY